MRDFAERVVVITGAGSGLGQALALRFAAQKASLALADVDAKALAKTVEVAQTYGGKVQAYPLDVSRRAAVEKFASSVWQEFGRVDIVINNAGVALSQTVEDMRYADFEWVMEVNFWGVVYGSKAFLPYLKQAPEGCLINISSVFGLVAVPTQAAYNASKFAVRGFTEALRSELASTRMRVLCIHPGGIKTNIARNARFYRAVDGGLNRSQAVADFDRMALTSADEAAATIIKALRKGQTRVLVGPDAWVADKLQRLIPGAYDRVVRMLVGGIKRLQAPDSPPQ